MNPLTTRSPRGSYTARQLCKTTVVNPTYTTDSGFLNLRSP
ncbi:MAG TPA: hypothetical protein V6D27_14780 [Vampirovibrionales bacterium]